MSMATCVSLCAPFKHFMLMLQRDHAAAFSKERNMAGWEREGILPKFNRREYWRLKSEVSRGMAPHKRDSGNSSAKSASGGTALPVSQILLVATLQTYMPVPGRYS